MTTAEQTTSSPFLPTKIFDLYYGEPNSGKSDAIYHVAKQALRENPGKKVKLIIGDGSATTYEPLLLKGHAEMCEFYQRPWPMDVMKKLCEGWWLKDPKNPTSELVKPTPEELNRFCLTVYEGASVAGKYILGNVKGGLAQQAASGVKMGPDPTVIVEMGVRNDKGVLTEGPGTAFGTNGAAHYQAAQGNLMDFINESKVLPGHVIWTAHETILSDEVNIGDLKNPIKVKKNVVIGGPEVSGKALAPIVQRAFGNTIHFQTVSKLEQADDKDEFVGKTLQELAMQYRIWTQNHLSPNAFSNPVVFKACTRNVGDDFPLSFTGGRGKAIEAYYRAIYAEKMKELETL